MSISGYGESGPYVNRPGQDMLLQAMSGAMFNVGRACDPPAPAGTYAVDAITGYGAFEAALAGLLHRERTGEGQLVTVNMLDSAIAVQAQELSIYTVGGIPQHRGREAHGHAYIRAPYGTFATADGYLALAFPPLAQLGEVLGIGEFAGMDDDFDGHTRRDEITALVRARLTERTTAEWLAEFGARGIWAGPVYDYAGVLADPQVQHNGSLVSYDHPTEGRVTTPGFPYRFSVTPPQVYRGAPLAGEQTREILAELGYDGESVDQLAAGGVVAVPEAPGEPAAAAGPGGGQPSRGDLVTVRLTGLTWDHPRGYLVLDALAGTLEPDVSVRWQRQPLEGFESRPLRTLADDFDLLVVDHPGLGEAVRDGALLPLDEVFSEPELAGWRTASVGASFDSYVLDGRPWALPLDAAAQVAVARPDLMDTRPASWAQACQVAREHRTALCLGGPHALLMFSAICVAAGSPPAGRAGPGRGRRRVRDRGGGHGRPRGHGRPAGPCRPRAVPAQPDRRARRDGGRRRPGVLPARLRVPHLPAPAGGRARLVPAGRVRRPGGPGRDRQRPRRYRPGHHPIGGRARRGRGPDQVPALGRGAGGPLR